MNGVTCIKEILNWNFKSSWYNEDTMRAYPEQYFLCRVAKEFFVQVITSCRTVTPGTSNSVCGVSFHPKDRDVVCIGQFPLLALTGALYVMMLHFRSAGNLLKFSLGLRQSVTAVILNSCNIINATWGNSCNAYSSRKKETNKQRISWQIYNEFNATTIQCNCFHMLERTQVPWTSYCRFFFF